MKADPRTQKLALYGAGTAIVLSLCAAGFGSTPGWLFFLGCAFGFIAEALFEQWLAERREPEEEAEPIGDWPHVEPDPQDGAEWLA